MLRRINLILPLLRTALFGRAPPEKRCAESPLQQTLEHLRELYGDTDPIEAFQLNTQIDFFAL
jgi:hypothetical protein